MNARIYASKYKDREAVTLESAALTAQFMPETGGKMVSLTERATGLEFLVQRPGGRYLTPVYDGDYVRAECSGFDDMFPTIDEVYYERFPWTGVRIPDHGEVYALKWDHEIKENELSMGVCGVRLPYRLEKTIRFADERTLCVEYRAVNLSGFPMDCLWAAHPMIRAEEGGRMIAPFADGAPATCVFSLDEGLGKYGSRIEWPRAVRRDGRAQRLDETGAFSEKENSYKIFFDEPAPEGWFTYVYPSGTALTLRFPPEKVPYLGLWVNEGYLHGFHNVAPEPCTGSWDRIDLARRHGQFGALAAYGEETWFLELHADPA